DEHVVRLVLTEILESNGFSVIGASNGREALEVFRRDRPASVLLDLKMPDMDGRETLQELKKIDPDVPVIVVTAYGDIPTAVEAIKYGAYDFIVKPPKIETLVLTLKRAMERVELEREVRRLNTAVESSLEWLLGRSPEMKRVIQQIHQVAWSDFTIIIEGETGTGKSFIAQQIHSLSRRADKPFTSVDMGVIPEALVESELFGYEKGAFTGADKKKKGYFEMTDGGTLLIDELQNMSPLVQSKLLGVVEQKRIFPVGGTRPVDVDVRIIAATNTDIKESVKEKRFREDLFFRLSEFVITLPPLRERVEDIPFLANRFLMDAGAELNKQMKAIDDDSILLLMRYPWPGNVRELKNVIRRAVLLSDNGVVRPEHIDLLIDNKAEDGGGGLPMLPLKELSAMAAKDVEKKAIRQAMKMTKGNKTKAASMLQIDYKTLLTKIKEYSI
ncbi:MAG TPA: sigma-54-dependent Fis family transcriptional regulator, partial [Nitrospirae bacterium]|nr:sigma-54-dependent Fis family transcriptional regulator [Nitrospirota bacterium]